MTAAEPRSSRCFVAVAMNLAVQSRMRKVRGGVHVQRGTLRWVDPDLAHLTLRFLGDVCESRLPAVTDTIRSATSACRSFTLEVGGVGAFPARDDGDDPLVGRPVRVLWLACGPTGPLVELADVLAVALEEFGREDRFSRFVPHVTLARARSIARLGCVPEIEKPVEMEVREIELVQSTLGPRGPRYDTLERFPLAAHT